ncbi:MAG: TonB-dependent receptor [Bacteroidales bacterium]
MTRLNSRIWKIPGLLSVRVGILFIISFFLLPELFAQGFKVTGVVTDGITNETLPGVNVLVVGTTDGAITDFDGKYEITIPSADANIVFSFMGYNSENVSVEGKTRIDISLIPDIKSLEEVVVIGYGSARKADLSGSISTLSSKEIKDIPVSNVAQALTGRIAGLQITTSDGAPDAEVIMKIRGGGSLTQDNSPLLVVDGFPVSSIKDISPMDIETFTILKDASSTAIYGARGAYGVILITTKGAKSGKTKVSYNGYVQQRRFPLERSMEVLSPYEYVLMRYEYAQVGGRTTPEDFQNLFGAYDDLELYKYQKGTDWQEKMYGIPQYSQSHNLSISGGTDNTRVYLSISHNNDDGLLINSKYKRTNLNFKLNHEITKNLRLELNTRYSDETTDGAGTSGGSDLKIRDVVTARPVSGLVDNILIGPEETGDEYEQFRQSLIPPDEKINDDYKKKLKKRFDLNAAINWHLVKGLTFRSEIGAGYTNQNEKRFYGSKTGASAKQGFNLPMGKLTNIINSDYRVANILTYDIDNPVFKLSFMAGQEILNKSSNIHELLALKYPKEIEPERLFANMGLGEVVTNSTREYSPNRLSSFLGRANIILLERYIFNVTFRADGSSKFAPGNQWGYFPASSFAWRISNEPFMKNLSFVNDLKLRAGIGMSGNNNIDDDIWRPVYILGSDNNPGFGDVPQPFYEGSSGFLANPELQWETKITQNIATEFSLFNNKLVGTFELYNNKSKDLLLEIDLPPNTGYTKMIENIGSTTIKGLEITLNNTFVRTHNFMISASFNIGFEKFVIDKLSDRDEIPFSSGWSGDVKGQDDYRIAVGSEMGLMYGWVTDGFYTVDDFESYNEATGKYVLKDGVPSSELTNTRPGSLKLRDLDTNGIVDLSDRKIIGHASPKHYGGFGISSEYKGFDFNMYFTWKYGFDVYNTSQIQFTNTGREIWGNMLDRMNSQNRFKYINDNGELVTDLDELGELNNNAIVWSPFSAGESVLITHSDAIEDGSYLRLSTVTLGYTLPQNLTTKINLERCRIYFTIQNAWLWTKYRGFDPEVNTRPSDIATPNLDDSAYPQNRSFSLGLNINF